MAASVFMRFEGLVPSGVVGVVGVEADARCMNCCLGQFHEESIGARRRTFMFSKRDDIFLPAILYLCVG